MNKTKTALISGLCLLTTACALRPLTQDYSGDNEQTIVHKIRCEIQTALIGELVKELKKPEHDISTNLIGEALAIEPGLVSTLTENGLARPNNRAILGRLTEAGIPNSAYNKRIDPQALERIRGFLDAAIAYRFRFNITENNNAAVNASFGYPFTNGTAALGLNALNNRSRLSERIIELGDSFKSFQKLECADEFRVQYQDYLYPITGLIGMAEVIETFIDLDDNIGATESKFTSLTDQLRFPTNLSTTVTPSVQINPGGPRSFRLANADVPLLNQRIDLHEVTFTISPAPEEKPPTSTRKINLGDGVKLEVTVPAATSRKVTRSKTKSPKLFEVTSENKRNIDRAASKLRSSIAVQRESEVEDAFE